MTLASDFNELRVGLHSRRSKLDKPRTATARFYFASLAHVEKAMRYLAAVLVLLLAAGSSQAQQYDLLLQGGHVVDPKNNLSAVRDVAIRGGRIAAVDAKIDPTAAFKAIDVAGLYVTPGLVDLHVHVFAGTGEPRSYAGDNSVYPDGFTLRSGVTTAVDAGCAGWRNFEEFRTTVIVRSKTRILAMLNIVGHGMRGSRFENNLDDMEVGPTAEMAQRHKGLIVGIKTAHYSGPEFAPVERAVEAGKLADIPVMVDFGRSYHDRSLLDLMSQKLRPGDIYTHVYSGLRGELDSTGRANLALLVGRRRGVLLDVGHGGGSFAWRVAVPIVREGILPDTISTDLHVGSMNGPMKDMLNVMSKFLALGLSLEEVIARSTWNAARAIKQEQLGHLSVGAAADIAVLRVEKGEFGFLDVYGARQPGKERVACEMTLRDGRIVYDLNGLGRPEWTTLPMDYRETGDPRWDGTRRRRLRGVLP
jgi:dihydroorotase